MDGSSSGLPASKKSHKPSTLPGTPVVASMLLGEHILYSLSLCFLVFILNQILLFFFQRVLWWPWLRPRGKRMMKYPSSCGGELFSYSLSIEFLLFVLTFSLDLFEVTGRRVWVLLRLLHRLLLKLRC